jgi:hypothetical protein
MTRKMEERSKMTREKERREKQRNNKKLKKGKENEIRNMKLLFFLKRINF